MYLNVHYPSDVLVGAILGSASAWVTWEIYKKLHAKKKN
jgi:membrane-associated phospholipid phosphatase